jgi:2'-5' RNA ligase
MRVFIALPISDEVKTRLATAVQRHTANGIDVAWCKRDQFHLTLAFLGEISPAILPHLETAAKRVCATVSPFVCRAYGFGYFGSKRNPAALWAGVDLSDDLAALQERLWLELTRLGYKNREKDYRPHITLGRSREAPKNRELIEAMAADEDAEFGSWEATRITFFESLQTPKGPVYRTLLQIPLAGG